MTGLFRPSIKFRSEVLGRRIERVITAITGFRVVIGLAEMRHAQEHFLLPDMIFLELLEQVLRDPTRIFVDDRQHPQTYHLFYRLEKGATSARWSRQLQVVITSLRCIPQVKPFAIHIRS